MFQGAPNMKSWLGMFLLGTLQIGLPYVFYSKAVKNVPAIDAVLVSILARTYRNPSKEKNEIKQNKFEVKF
jgi:drug/metabolite transporter (DMT)-like permease